MMEARFEAKCVNAKHGFGALIPGTAFAFGWTFGLGALLYPLAWILRGFCTVELGLQGAEASVLWLFGPAVGLLVGSLIALFAVMALESVGLKDKPLFAWAYGK